MARSAEGLPTKPKAKVKPKKRKARATPAPEPEKLPTLNISINKGHKYQPGNRFWEVRSSHGRKPLFATPEVLWNAATEYFAWVEKNPLWETKLFSYEGTIVDGEMPKMRIMTLTGMSTFLDINMATWYEYKGRPDFSSTCEAIEQIIRDQGVQGASAGLLNPMIVARVHGLKESIAAEHTGAGGGPIKTVNAEITPGMDEKAASQIYRTLINPSG